MIPKYNYKSKDMDFDTFAGGVLDLLKLVYMIKNRPKWQTTYFDYYSPIYNYFNHPFGASDLIYRYK